MTMSRRGPGTARSIRFPPGFLTELQEAADVAGVNVNAWVIRACKGRVEMERALRAQEQAEELSWQERRAAAARLVEMNVNDGGTT